MADISKGKWYVVHVPDERSARKSFRKYSAAKSYASSFEEKPEIERYKDGQLVTSK